MARGIKSTAQRLTVLQFGDFAEKQRKIMAGVMAGQANIKAERASQKALQDKENQFVINQYKRVGELKETGGATFDQGKDDFFNDQIDKYIKIKNGIDNGSVAADVGGRALAKINDQVQAYKDAAPQILAQAKLIQEGMKIPMGEPGALSAVNSTVQQKILLDLIQGGDVRIVDNEGELVLFQPPGVDKDGKKTEGGMININELINLEASGVEYVRTVPDITNPLKASFTGVVGEEGKWNWSENENRFMTIETIIEDDREITTKTMTPEQRENIREAIYASKSLNPIIDNESYMQSVWVDMMGEDDEWNPADQNKVEKARYWLAQKSIDDNAAEAGIKEIMSMGRKSGDGNKNLKKLAQQTLKEKKAYISKQVNTDKDMLSFLFDITGEEYTIEDDNGTPTIYGPDGEKTSLTSIYNPGREGFVKPYHEGWGSDTNIAAIADRFLSKKYYESISTEGTTSDPANLGI